MPMKTATPIGGPHSVPLPPTRSAATKSVAMLKLATSSGLTNPLRCANNAPPTPATAPPKAMARRRYRSGLMPTDAAAGSLSRTASRPRPSGDRTRLRTAKRHAAAMASVKSQ